jgi:hypothetical protein
LRLKESVATSVVASSLVTHPGADAVNVWKLLGSRRPKVMSDQPLAYTRSAPAAASATAIRAGLALTKAITLPMAAPTTRATALAVKPA